MSPLRAAAALLLLLALAGCGSLPTFVPDLARRPNTGVQLEGARGPLSAAQSKAVLDKLEAGARPTDIFDRHLALEEAIVGSPLTTGNSVRLLQDGPATYRAMFEAIDAARDHINMETYILDDDEVGRQFAQRLGKALADGVVVQDVGLHVNVIGGAIDGGQHGRVGGRAVLQQQHPVAGGQRAADDGFFEGQVALEDIGHDTAGLQARQDCLSLGG